jgi:hypothetical protein
MSMFRVCVRLLDIVSELPSHLTHTPKDDCAVGIHALGSSPQRSRENCRETRRLFPADVARCALVVITTRRLGTINAWAPLDYVEIYLQNTPFAEGKFRHWHEAGLCALAEDRPACSEKQIFYKLLRNGGSSASAFAVQVLLGSNLDLVPIESMVLVEVRVLSGDYSMLEIGRDLAERNEFVLFAIRLVETPGLQAALDVHRCRLWVDPPGCHKDERGKRPKKHHADEPSNKGSEEARPKRGARVRFGDFSHVSE